MFHNIDPNLASAALFVIIVMALGYLGNKVAQELKASFEEDKNDDREALARDTGMINTNKKN